jgi:hypothetical protein
MSLVALFLIFVHFTGVLVRVNWMVSALYNLSFFSSGHSVLPIMQVKGTSRKMKYKFKIYKPDVTNLQHKDEIFKGKVMHKNFNFEIWVLFAKKLNTQKKHELSVLFIMLSFGYKNCNFGFTKRLMCSL